MNAREFFPNRHGSTSDGVLDAASVAPLYREQAASSLVETLQDRLTTHLKKSVALSPNASLQEAIRRGATAMDANGSPSASSRRMGTHLLSNRDAVIILQHAPFKITPATRSVVRFPQLAADARVTEFDLDTPYPCTVSNDVVTLVGNGGARLEFVNPPRHYALAGFKTNAKFIAKIVSRSIGVGLFRGQTSYNFSLSKAEEQSEEWRQALAFVLHVTRLKYPDVSIHCSSRKVTAILRNLQNLNNEDFAIRFGEMMSH